MRVTVARFILAVIIAAPFLTSPASSRALASQARTTSTCAMLSGVTRDHIFLTDDTTNKAVDVTDTVYTSQGQTYAVLNGASIAIVLDQQRGNVYDTDGNAIGYIQRVTENPNEACSSVCGVTF